MLSAGKLLVVASVLLMLFGPACKAVGQVADAVKWLSLPGLAMAQETGSELSNRISALIIESHLARYQISLEALSHSSTDRSAFLAQNTKLLFDKVRLHMDKQIAVQLNSVNNADEVEALTASVHAGIRSAQLRIQATPIDKMVYAPLPRAFTNRRMRLSDWWRKWNVAMALRSWRAKRLLDRDNRFHGTNLQTLLEADMERRMAQVRNTIAEPHSSAPVKEVVPAAQRTNPDPRQHTWSARLTQIRHKLRTVIN